MNVLDRLMFAGDSEVNAREALATGRVYVDGVQVVDPGTWVAERAEIVERVAWPDPELGAAG